MVRKIRKAVIPVAGLGTRMLPATKAIPKELLPVYDRPIIEHVVQEAISAGITEIILVTRSGKEAIENHFDANYELEHRLQKKGKDIILRKVKGIVPDGVNLTSIRQNDALGLGHAVLCAKHLLDGQAFAVLLPDVFILDAVKRSRSESFVAMADAWNKTGIGQVMVERVGMDTIEKYGVANLGLNQSQPFKNVALKGLVEKPSADEAPSNLAILGRYILPFTIIEILEKTKAGVGGEIQLTDAMDDLLKYEGLNVFETDAQIFDCGHKQGFLGANFALGMRDPDVSEYLTQLFDILKQDRE